MIDLDESIQASLSGRRIGASRGGARSRLLHERIRLQSVTIDPDSDSEGMARLVKPLGSTNAMLDLWTDQDQLRVERYVRAALAGGIAQRRSWSQSARGGDNDDLSTANQLLAKLVGSDEELRAYMRLLQIQTRQLVRIVWWSEIRSVARVAAGTQADGEASSRDH